VQRLRPLLDYVCRLHWRAGRTEEGEAALKRFVYRFLSGFSPKEEVLGASSREPVPLLAFQLNERLLSFL
jgi:hypothetical protein